MALQYTFQNNPNRTPRLLPAVKVAEETVNDPIGSSIAAPYWSTKVGPGIPGNRNQGQFEHIRPRLAGDPIISASDYKSFARKRISSSALRSAAKGILLWTPEATVSKPELINVEMKYQIALQNDPALAGQIAANKDFLIRYHGLTSDGSIYGAISRVRGHDPDNAGEHEPEFIKWNAWTRRINLGNPASIAKAVAARKAHLWNTIVRTSMTYAERANELKQGGGKTLAKKPLVGVATVKRQKKGDKPLRSVSIHDRVFNI